MSDTGKIIVISAPSGAGKTTVCDELLKQMNNLGKIVTFTTRKPRRGEKNGVDYNFVSRDEFVSMRDENEFLEWAEVHTNFYGTAKKSIKEVLEQGKHVLLNVDIQGGHSVRKIYGSKALLIFLKPPNMEVLKKRLRKRGSENDETLALRLKNAEKEMSLSSDYDHSVINDVLQDTVEECRKLIQNFTGF